MKMKEHDLRKAIVVLIILTTCFGEFIPPHFECGRYTPFRLIFINVTDTLEKGTVIATIDDLTGINEASCDVTKDFLRIDSNNLTLVADMRRFCTASVATCSIKCQKPGSKENEIDIRMNIERLLTYNITLKHEDKYWARVKEMTPKGTPVKFNSSIEIDFDDCIGGGFPGQRVQLIQNSSTIPFVWGAETRFDSLTVNDLIDYETNQSFFLPLRIEFFNFQTVHATATTTIRVEIEDIDDNDPVFSIQDINNSIFAHYVLKIQEGNSTLVNMQLPAEPEMIHAYDTDFGINETLVYSITEQKEAGLFAIDSSTGGLSVTRKLDRELEDSYRIIIKASQTDKPSRFALALVLFTVLDVDDNLPAFKPDSYTAEVTEHAISGTKVAQLNAHDPDEGDNSNFTCVLFNTSLPLIVETVPGGCTVRVKDSEGFDREAFPDGMVFQVGAMATLRGEFGINNATVNLTLKDINDISPKFTSAPYTFFLNATKGSAIGTILAEDPDEGRNGNVTYLMLSSVVQKEDCDEPNEIQLPFYLNKNSGVVTKTSETSSCKLYRTIIEACDNPTINRRCSFTKLTVTYTVSQQGQNISQAVKIKENSPIGSYIGALKCSGNGNIYHHDSHDFEVDSATGFIQTSVVLDRENISSYNFYVDVFDQSNTLICGVNVTATVLDANDNAPTFNTQSYVFNLPTNPADGMVMGYIQADDRDIGENAELRYMLYNQKESRFALNETTGVISVRSAAMLVTCDIISLPVTARDSGVPVMEAFAQVHIVCQDRCR